MQELEEQLGEQFIRVHRGYLVNLCHIGELDLKHKEIHMSNGEKCFFSRNAKKLLLIAGNCCVLESCAVL